MKKENRRRRSAALVCGSMLALALAGGTLAYLTDTDSDVNVMTLGNVDIVQHEYQRAEGVDHDAGSPGAGGGVQEGALVPFEQGQALMPAVPANNAGSDYTAEMDTADLFFWGDYVYSGTAGNGLWDDANLSNVMDKMVFVENTGKSDAYFRTIIAFECPEGMEYSEGSDKEFMMNTNGSELYKWENLGYSTIDGTRYLLMVATYQKALAPGNQAHPSLLQVVMTHNATNEDMALLGDTYEILVFSQAVQADGFNAVTDDSGNVTKSAAAVALDAAFGEITNTNHPWIDGFDSTAISYEELKAAMLRSGTIEIGQFDDDDTKPDYIENNGKAITINGNGNTLESGTPSDYGFISKNGSVSILNDFSLVSGGGGIGATAGAKVTFNSGDVHVHTASTSGRYVFYAGGEGSEITINDGIFSWDKNDNQKRAYIYAMAGTKVVVNGGTFGPASTRSDYTAGIMGDGTVIIQGGTFGFDPSAWVADGYEAVKNGSTWTVSAK